MKKYRIVKKGYKFRVHRYFNILWITGFWYTIYQSGFDGEDSPLEFDSFDMAHRVVNRWIASYAQKKSKEIVVLEVEA